MLGPALQVTVTSPPGPAKSSLAQPLGRDFRCPSRGREETGLGSTPTSSHLPILPDSLGLQNIVIIKSDNHSFYLIEGLPVSWFEISGGWEGDLGLQPRGCLCSCSMCHALCDLEPILCPLWASVTRLWMEGAGLDHS